MGKGRSMFGNHEYIEGSWIFPCQETGWMIVLLTWVDKTRRGTGFGGRLRIKIFVLRT